MKDSFLWSLIVLAQGMNSSSGAQEVHVWAICPSLTCSAVLASYRVLSCHMKHLLWLRFLLLGGFHVFDTSLALFVYFIHWFSFEISMFVDIFTAAFPHFIFLLLSLSCVPLAFPPVCRVLHLCLTESALSSSHISFACFHLQGDGIVSPLKPHSLGGKLFSKPLRRELSPKGKQSHYLSFPSFLETRSKELIAS